MAEAVPGWVWGWAGKGRGLELARDLSQDRGSRREEGSERTGQRQGGVGGEKGHGEKGRQVERVRGGGFHGRKAQGLWADKGLEGDGRETAAVIVQGIFGGRGALEDLGSVGACGWGEEHPAQRAPLW